MKNRPKRTKRTITFGDLQKARKEIEKLPPSLPTAIPEPSFVVKFPVGFPAMRVAKVEKAKQPEIKHDFFGFITEEFDVEELFPAPKENINNNWR